MRVNQVVRPLSAHTRRQETIVGLSRGEIERKLGFAPLPDFAGPDEAMWLFTADDVLCSVWSYKGSERNAVWSAYGPRPILEVLFGAKHVRD